MILWRKRFSRHQLNERGFCDDRGTSTTYHLFPEEFESLQSPQCLCTSLDILEHNMGLASHFGGLHGHNVENGAVCGEQGIECRPEIIFLNSSVGQICAVESKNC